MKSKFNISLMLFISVLILITTITYSNANSIENTNKKYSNTNKMGLESTFEVSDKMLLDSSLNREDLATQWKNLFTQPRSSSCSKVKAKLKAKAVIEEKQKKRGRISEKTKLPWVKLWGYGDAAYLFDYLDPVFLDPIIKSFEESFETLQSIDNKDNEKYEDKFAQGKRKKKLGEKLVQIDPVIYKNSINTVQIHTAMKDWGWYMKPGIRDYAYDLVSRYDVDGDGRLNPREMMLANIWHNKDILGKGKCMYCMADIARQLDAMFIFFDCQNAGAISVEDLWEKLPKLVRPTNKWNVFGIESNLNIRTSCLNDFAIKNGLSKPGFITKKEFRNGILLGYWDRQTNRREIISDQSRSLRKLRWDRKGKKDKIAFEAYTEKLKQISTFK